jgi:putative aldouronate transport system substrate-binding protein
MKRSKRNWITTSSFVTLAAALALTGCSGGTPASTTGTTGNTDAPKTAVKQPPVEISIMNSYNSAEPPVMDEPFMKAFESYTHAKLKITWVPDSVYNDKINATMASGDLPDIIIPRALKAPSIINSARSDFFWEVGKYLKDYPNLNKINKVAYDNLSIDGKVYGIPRPRPLARNGFTIRKDWLQTLNLKEPTTLDELYQVIKAFALNDPDKNGKNDTYGLVEAKGLSSFASLLAFHGGPFGWKNEDGKLTPDFMTPEYMDTMKFYKRLFDEKLMNLDFAVTQASQRSNLVNQGKAGIYGGGAMDDVATKHVDFNKLNPNGILDVFSRIKGPKGDRVISTTGNSGAFMIPKMSVKTEEKLKQILTFLDKSGDPAMVELFTWGVEGVHHKVENGKKVKIDEGKFTNIVNIVGQYQITDFIGQAVEGEKNEVIIRYQKMMKDNEAVILVNPTSTLISDTFTEVGSELGKIIEDAMTKYIMGKLDDAGWKQEIDKWKANGGDKVIAEYTADYKKISKK